MKKIACLSALACVLAVTTGSAMARSTITGGYAQGDMQGEVNKAKGFNLKYHYDDETNPWGWLTSFTYLQKSRTNDADIYNKGQYYGITAGPSIQLGTQDWVRFNALVGIGVGTFRHNSQLVRDKHESSDVGVAYGAGFTFTPLSSNKRFAIDVGYEQSRIRSVDVGTWIAGIGYAF